MSEQPWKTKEVFKKDAKDDEKGKLEWLYLFKNESSLHVIHVTVWLRTEEGI